MARRRAGRTDRTPGSRGFGRAAPARASRRSSAPATPAGGAADLERLIEELSAALVGALADDVDAQLHRWLQRLVILLRLDHGVLLETGADGTPARTQEWGQPGRRRARIDLGIDRSPWLTARLRGGEVLCFTAPAQLPADAADARERWERAGVRAGAFVGLLVGGKVVGYLGLASLQPQARPWPRAFEHRLRLVGDIVGGALERRRLADERRRAEAQSLQLREQLAHMARAATLGEHAASLAHELSQPLMAVLNNAQAAERLLATAPPDLAEARAALAEIVESDRRAGDVIRKMRAMFRRAPSERVLLRIPDLLHEIARLLSADALARDVALTLDLEPNLPGVLGDATQIQQVIMNLALNAFDAVAAQQERPREVRVRAERRGPDGVAIAVSDRGCGISEAMMPRLFEPFFTTKPGGMGMGLVIARSIVESHGGRIAARNDPAGGATFEFTLSATALGATR